LLNDHLSAVVLEALRDHDATGPVRFNLNFPNGLPAGRWLRIRYHM